MKRNILTVFLALALIFTLTSCTSPQKNPDGQTQSGGRSIIISAEAMYNEAAMLDYEEYFIRPLQESFPDDEISYQSFADRQSLQVQVAAGAGPDILHLDGPTDAVEFYKADRIIALDKYARQYGWADLFYEWAYGAGYYDGKLISLPNSFEGMVMYYNENVFAENGWSYPANMNELVTIMDDAKSKGIVAIAFGNSDYQGAVDWLYSTFMSCYPGPDELKKALEGETRVDEGLVLESMELMQDWWEKGYFSDGKSMAMSWDDMIAMFADGRAAMMINGTWATYSLQITYEADWIADAVPELRPGAGRIVPLATGGAYVINAAGKNHDFAAEVLNQIFADTQSHLKAVDEAYFQPYPIKAFDVSKMTSWDPKVSDLYNDLIAAMQTNHVGFCAWTFFPSDMRVYMNENTDNMFLRNLTPKAFMTGAQAFLDQALADGTAPTIP